MESYFSGKTVVVTGGSSGIGLAFSQLVARAGATVVLAARRKDVLDEARDAIVAQTRSARVETLPLDVSAESDVATRVGELVKRLPVDVLVNNAGVVMPGRFLELEGAEFRRMMDVNYFGTVHMCRAVLPQMVQRRRGHVLNVSSFAGVIGIYGYTAYAASKFAIVGFSQCLRAEMWPHGVRVSVCMPPDTDTPQLAFENQHKPAETKAIAGNVKTLSAQQVAHAMAKGLVQNQFEIYCDVGSRFVAATNGVLPSVIRWTCDNSQRKAAASRAS
jgi:3-dehydrosphinganine reductase